MKTTAANGEATHESMKQLQNYRTGSLYVICSSFQYTVEAHIFDWSKLLDF